MPVTKTAKRALRGSKNKTEINKTISRKLEIAVRAAKKAKDVKKVSEASSLADRAAKKNVIHKNKAARIKSQLSKLISKKEVVKTEKKVTKKKSSKK